MDVAMVVQQIVRAVRQMAAFHENRRTSLRCNDFRRFQHLLAVRDVVAMGQHHGFRQVRRQNPRHRQQDADQRLLRRRLQKTMARRRNHHGIENDVREFIVLQTFRHRFDNLHVRQHADFDGVRPDVRKHAVQLFCDKFARNGQDPLHARRVLRRQRRDDGHAVNAMRRHGLQIRLDSRAAAAIRTRNRQNCFHNE